jgi:predicted PurR-regulated permease PerM
MQSRPFWFGLPAVCAILLWLVRGILLPFVLGMAVAYLLDPLVGRIERRGISRTVAAGVIVVSSYGIALVGVLLLAPLLARQIIDLATNLPDYCRAAYDGLAPVLHRLLATSGTERVIDLAAKCSSASCRAPRSCRERPHRARPRTD